MRRRFQRTRRMMRNPAPYLFRRARRLKRNPRPYPFPGKFEGGYVIDEYIYIGTLEGWGDDHLGDVTEVGFFAVRIDFRGDEDAALEEIAREHGDTLTDEEREFLRAQKGAILIEDDRGFVSVEYYETRRELDERWKELQKIEKDIWKEYGEE